MYYAISGSLLIFQTKESNAQSQSPYEQLQIKVCDLYITSQL